ncbi:MAG: site-specific integrase [Actinomycetes bacterium]
MPDTPQWEREKHAILGGKVHLYRRGDSDNWHCSAFLKGRNRRKSTKETSLPLARQIAEDWYLELRGKARANALPEQLDPPSQTRRRAPTPATEGLIPAGLKRRLSFNEAADRFTAEYGIINKGEVSERWVAGHQSRLTAHLRPYFGDKWCDEIDGGMAQAYRLFRMRNGRNGKAPARNTLNSEITTLNHVLGTAFRSGAMLSLPDLSPPFKSSTKVGVRPWFSPEEYKVLRQATADNARKTKRDEDRWYAEQLHDLVLFQANTGLRPDETKNLQFRDVAMVKDDSTGELILEISVRGKRGVGFCKSMPGAVKPFQRLLNRPKWTPQGRKPRSQKKLAEWESKERPAPALPGPTDVIFPGSYLKLFNKILDRTGLKFDRDENPRTMYSLRHSYICFRLSEGADLYNIAKNCRTSVEVIQKHYASHIKDLLDASAINTRRPRRRPQREEVRPK